VREEGLASYYANVSEIWKAARKVWRGLLLGDILPVIDEKILEVVGDIDADRGPIVEHLFLYVDTEFSIGRV
jgi:hypothetical protein